MQSVNVLIFSVMVLIAFFLSSPAPLPPSPPIIIIIFLIILHCQAAKVESVVAEGGASRFR